ncbi:MAG: ribosomal protein S18-alanine N-acetyltransferase [Gammaproteobacteria bacterium]|jgi:ribosomal-protein-alanine N-acetyltransferase|nr:ribosomal protein S18-alanine N-acetyltransferase [Gammaproteobacteria bacterium]
MTESLLHAPAAGTTSVRIRPMLMADLAAVTRNETRAYAFPWSPGIFADCLAAEHECWVLQDDEELIGHGILSAAAGEAHLLNLCVARDRQGRGLGRLLLEWMVERARSRRATVIFLEVRPSNRAACQLYDSMGFCDVGRRPGYYPDARGSEDARVMAMELLP